MFLKERDENKAFFFYKSYGDYTGQIAHSLEEFLEKIDKVDNESLEFHLYRRDFQRWIREIPVITELSESLDEIVNLDLKGEQLRALLHYIISRFLNKKRGYEIETKESSIFEKKREVTSKPIKEYPLAPQEHAYELKMEKRIKKAIENQKK